MVALCCIDVLAAFRYTSKKKRAKQTAAVAISTGKGEVAGEKAEPSAEGNHAAQRVVAPRLSSRS